MEDLRAWLVRRPLVVGALLFTSGVASAPHSPVSGAPLLVVSIAGAAFLLLRKQIPRLVWSVLALSAFLAGAGSAQTRSMLVADLPAGVGARELLLEGTVDGWPRRTEGRTRFRLQVDAEHPRAAATRSVRYGVRLSCRGDLPLLPGDRIRVPARLFIPAEAANPGQFSGRVRAWAEAMPWTGSCRTDEVAVLGPPPHLARLAGILRQRFAELTANAVPDAGAAGLILALAVGDRDGVDDAVNADFGASGLAHILSVSGLHITVVAAGLYLVLRRLLGCSERLLLTGRVGAVAGLAAIPACWAYVVLTGSEVPAVRSAWMASALFAARGLQRDFDPATGVALALLAVLGWDPAAFHDLSFRLSFGAVAGLMLLMQPLRALLPVAPPAPGDHGWRRRLLEPALSAAAGSLAATLVTAPLIAESFHRISLIGVLSNVVALPVASALTILCALSAVLAVLWEPLAGLLLVLAAIPAAFLVWLARASAALPLATVLVPSFSLLTQACFLGLMVCLCAHRPYRVLSRRAGLGFLGALVLAGVFHLAAPWFSRELAVTFFSVGQGDATLIRLPGGRNVLVDGGGEMSGRFDPGARIVVPALVELGARRLEAVVLSHPHPDHGLGLLAVLRTLPVRELWWAEPTVPNGLLEQLQQTARERGVALRPLHSPQQLTPQRLTGVAPAQVEVLHPAQIDAATGVNDGSLVLRVSLGEVSFLLPGDIERDGEETVLPALGPATVLKAPHHGSRTSSTEAFVRRVAPGHVVFCVGLDNRFGFPHPEVEARYRETGCVLHRTDQHGAITFRTDGKRLKVERSLE